MSELTERQAEVLEFIRAFIKDNGFSPTRAEIADAHGVNPNGIQGHVTALVKKGALTIKPGSSRSIVPTKGFRVRIK